MGRGGSPAADKLCDLEQVTSQLWDLITLRGLDSQACGPKLQGSIGSNFLQSTAWGLQGLEGGPPPWEAVILLSQPCSPNGWSYISCCSLICTCVELRPSLEFACPRLSPSLPGICAQ